MSPYATTPTAPASSNTSQTAALSLLDPTTTVMVIPTDFDGQFGKKWITDRLGLGQHQPAWVTTGNPQRACRSLFRGLTLVPRIRQQRNSCRIAGVVVTPDMLPPNEYPYTCWYNQHLLEIRDRLTTSLRPYYGPDLRVEIFLANDESLVRVEPVPSVWDQQYRDGIEAHRRQVCGTSCVYV